MIKKLLLVAVVGAVALFGLKQTKVFGLLKNEVESAKAWAEDQVPVEKEISRIRKEIAELDRDVQKVGHEYAKETVDVRLLRDANEELRARIEDDTVVLKNRGEVISANGAERVKYGKTMMNAAEAKEKLRLDVAQLMSKKSSLDASEKALVVRERVKENLEKQFDAMKRQKTELRVQVDALEAEYKSLQLQQIESKFQTDSTRLAEIKQSIREMTRKVAIKREELNLAPALTEDAPTASTSTQSVEDILAPLDGKKPEKKAEKPKS